MHLFDFVFPRHLGITKIHMKIMGQQQVIISRSAALRDTLTLEETPECPNICPTIFYYVCCTTGFKIELPNARAGVCFVTDHLIYQPARRRCSLQAELLHVI
jgi:hypothetical protein